MGTVLKIKVCGMKYPSNIYDLIDLDIDYIGFIFYEKSKRYLDKNVPELNYGKIKKTGVFVEEKLNRVLQLSSENELDVIQLHGNETPRYCSELKENDIEIIKAFSIDDNFNFNICNQYSGIVDMFLFDTKGANPGGNGVTFNWSILEKYNLDMPFLLSGGITPHHVDDILAFQHKQCVGIDINSGFEISPAKKNIDEIRKFLKEIK
ncbi:MAG TPA: phosphoribosylanthranilate isomerase [Bacteroidetes bacterium]|nr:phosphoribosylanthranilate isomerase [Bacteroidota bacterium]